MKKTSLKKPTRSRQKLALAQQTIRTLQVEDLAQVRGAGDTDTCANPVTRYCW